MSEKKSERDMLRPPGHTCGSSRHTCGGPLDTPVEGPLDTPVEAPDTPVEAPWTHLWKLPTHLWRLISAMKLSLMEKILPLSIKILL